MPLFTPIGGGGIGKAAITSTTGSPTVDTSSRPGKTIYKFTGSGSITVDTAGYVEFLIVGGGGGGGRDGNGCGGAGGVFYKTSAYLETGTHTVTVGAGSNASGGGCRNGQSSVLGPYISPGGGGGSMYYSNTNSTSNGAPGGSGGGGTSVSGGPGIPGLGNDGGTSANGAAGGGAGGAGSGTTGGAGRAIDITGTNVIYGTGGSRTGPNGADNTGNGGGGGTVATSGGSGVVVVVTG